MRLQIHITGVCLFLCVVGPGFDSTSPTFVRSRARQGATASLPKKQNWAPSLGAGFCVDTISADVS